MPKPNLATNTPVTQVINPMEIRFIKTIWHNRNVSPIHRCLHQFFERNFGPGLHPFNLRVLQNKFFVHIHKPLGLWQRLNDITKTIGRTDALHNIFFFFEQPFRLQMFNKFRPSFFHGETSIFFASSRSHFPIFANHLNEADIITKRFLLNIHFKVDSTVRWRDTKRPSTFVHFYSFVGNNRNDQRLRCANIHCKRLTNILLVTRIIWVHCHSRIPQLSFWASSGNRDWKLFRIFEVIQFPWAININ